MSCKEGWLWEAARSITLSFDLATANRNPGALNLE